MRICVYGASSTEIDDQYIQETEKFGRMLAQRGHSLVFGGGSQGLMGAAARGVDQENGEIIGIAPTFFLEVDGVLYDHCSQFLYTETMRERKQLMEEHADAFVVTPGGIGTFEEFFEILTLKQLGRHTKPIVVFNILGYFDNMNAMIENAIEQKFMKPECRKLCAILNTPDDVLDYIEHYIGEKVDSKHYKNI